jgi:hypothetical protein
MKWEEATRHRDAERVAEVSGMSAADVRAMGIQTGRVQTNDSKDQTDTRTRVVGKQGPRGQDGGG